MAEDGHVDFYEDPTATAEMIRNVRFLAEDLLAQLPAEVDQALAMWTPDHPERIHF